MKLLVLLECTSVLSAQCFALICSISSNCEESEKGERFLQMAYVHRCGVFFDLWVFSCPL